jgi:hypothetical protein
VALAVCLWFLVVLASNGALGTQAYVNLARVRHAFLYATAEDFHRAQIVVSDVPRELSDTELARFLSLKDPSIHPVDAWGGPLRVSV